MHLLFSPADSYSKQALIGKKKSECGLLYRVPRADGRVVTSAK